MARKFGSRASPDFTCSLSIKVRVETWQTIPMLVVVAEQFEMTEVTRAAFYLRVSTDD
jgi:hypothetical protein